MGMTDFRLVRKLPVERRYVEIDVTDLRHQPSTDHKGGRIGRFDARLVEMRRIKQAGSRGMTYICAAKRCTRRDDIPIARQPKVRSHRLEN